MKKPVFSHKHSFFEQKAWAKNLNVCGIDEVGRGCLAGPLVTAAVIMPINTRLEGLNDSKLLSHTKRLELYKQITQKCLYSTAISSWREVDKYNIYKTTLKAMGRAYTSLIESHSLQLEKIKYVLVDAMPLKIHPAFTHDNLEVHHFPYGESISPSIAAASIVAKITRDRLMDKMDNFFPAYHLNKHKGYGTKAHQDSLHEHGPSIIHRKTFVKIKPDKQQDLFGGI